jgi:hypothetical protein
VQKLLAAAVVVAALAVPAAAYAQAGAPQPTEGTRFGVGAGLTLPMGDYADLDKLGFHALGLVQIPLRNSPVHLRADIMFSQTSHKSGFPSGNSTIIGGTVDLLYHLGDRSASLRPYVLGGLGYFNAKATASGFPSSSESKIGFGFGGGGLFGLGATLNAFVEARYMIISTSGGSTAFVPITFGLMFGGH